MIRRLTATAALTTTALLGLAACSSAAVVTSSSQSATGPESIAPSPTLADPSAPHSVCVDQLGDVTGLDLASATVTETSSALNFTMTTATPPSSTAYAAYDIELVAKNTHPLYNFSVIVQSGTPTFNGVAFPGNTKFTIPTAPQISGDTVSWSVPLSALPNLPAPSTGFLWSANAGGQSGSDRCPNAGSDTANPAMSAFPQ